MVMVEHSAQHSSGDSVTPKRKRVKTDYGVSPQLFIEVWEKSASVREAAQMLNMPKGIAQARAAGYRKQGVKLKRMPRWKTPALDVKGLNEFINRLGNEQSAPKE